MFYKNRNKGFTLIELLIVIIIIGILATVVLVFLTSARDEAKKSSIQSSLSSVVSAAAMCRDGDGTILDGDGGDNICNPVSIINSVYPSIDVCGSNASDTQFTVTSGGADDWRVTLTACDFANCVGDGNAYCDSSGCHFPPSGDCH